MSNNTEITSNGLVIASQTIAAMPDLTKVSNMLMEQMEKQKGNPNEVPVSEAMCQIAGRVMDVAKIQISAAALILKAQSDA